MTYSEAEKVRVLAATPGQPVGVSTEVAVVGTVGVGPALGQLGAGRGYVIVCAYDGVTKPRHSATDTNDNMNG